MADDSNTDRSRVASTGRALPLVLFADGCGVPALGLGTWHMGEERGAARREASALTLGLSLGMSLIDTAEMYGEGGAEEVVARAIAGAREQAFVVSKVYPHNASAHGVVAACERSLRRLRTDRIDLYLLHWRGRVPLVETVAGFERLRREGKIRRWGVSNFDVDDMQELLALPDGRHCAANQVLYHLGARGIEWQLLELCRSAGIVVMAYSPLGQGDLLGRRRLHEIARGVESSPAQLALAWAMSQRGVVAIPKAANPDHVRENREAAEVELEAATLAALDAAFPPPNRPTPLAVL